MAWIKTGTVALTNGSAIVTGTGTTWLNRVGPDDVFIDPAGVIYEILSVQSGTQLTLATNYAGTTNTTASYRIFPTQAYNLQVATAANQMIATFQPLLEAQLSSEVFQGRFSAGTTAAPGITFATRTDTGLSLVGVSDLAASAAGVEAIRISGASRFVGIGTSAPGRRFEIADSTRAIIRTTASSQIGTDSLSGVEMHAWDGTAVTSGASIFYTFSLQSTDPNYLKIYNNRNGGIAFYANSGERMRILPSGFTGIATPTPLSMLHVNGDIEQNNGQYIRGTLSGSVRTRYIGFNASNVLYFGGIDAAHSNMLFVNGGIQQMQIAANGNFAFGNVTPTHFLTATKDQNATSQLLVTNSDAGTVALAGVGASNGTDSIRLLATGSGYTGFESQLGIFMNAGKDFNVWSNSLATVRFQVKAGGTVHIGTTENMSISAGVTAAIPMLNVANTSKAIISVRGAATADAQAGGIIALQRTAAAVPGTLTTTGSADTLGLISGEGVAATTPAVLASSQIAFVADGAPTATAVPGKIAFRTASTGTPVERMVLTSTGRLGLNVAAPTAALDVSSGVSPAVVLGADSGGTTRTNVTTKVARIAIPHYTNAELPFGMISGISSATENAIEIGSNTAATNSATAIRMYTNTTRTAGTLGTERVRITGGGNIGFNVDADPTVNFELSAVGTAAATSFRIDNQTDTSYGQVQYIGSTFATADRQNNLEIVTGGASSGITFSPGNAAFAAHFASTGQFIHGAKIAYAGALAGAFTAPIQTHSTSNSGYSVGRWNATPANAGGFNFLKSRGAAIGTHTAVAAGDYLGYIGFSGSDGTAFREAARITAEVGAGTIAATSMPGDLVFWTSPDSTVTPTEKMRIEAAGQIGIGTSTPLAKLDIDAGTTVSVPVVTLAKGGSDPLFRLVSRNGSGSTTSSEHARIGLEYNMSTFNTGIHFFRGSTTTGGFMTFSANNGTEEMRINANGQVLVGTTTPVNATDLVQVNGVIRTHSASAGAVTFSRDVIPTSGQGLGANYFEGRGDATTYFQGASVIAIAEGTWSATSAPTAITLRTTSTGATVPAERVRVGQSGKVLVGLSTENASGGILQVSNGITFPATQSAVADANTLDDYEEGTFTPVINGVTTVGAGTYTTQAGRYTKIGNRVTVNARIIWTAHTGTGAMVIAGLPFTHSASAQINAVTITSQNLAFTGTLVGYITTNSTQMVLAQMTTNAAVAALPIDTSADIWFNATYEV